MYLKQIRYPLKVSLVARSLLLLWQSDDGLLSTLSNSRLIPESFLSMLSTRLDLLLNFLFINAQKELIPEGNMSCFISCKIKIIRARIQQQFMNRDSKLIQNLFDKVG